MLLAAGAVFAQVSVGIRIGPPPPDRVLRVQPPSPGAGYVWVAGYPNIPCARTWWLHSQDTVRRRRPDSDSDGNLSEDRSRGQQHQYKHFNLHDFDSLSCQCVGNANYKKHVAGPRSVEYGSASPALR